MPPPRSPFFAVENLDELCSRSCTQPLITFRMLDKKPSTRITLAEAMQHESVTREGVCIPRWEGEEVSQIQSITFNFRVSRGIPRDVLWDLMGIKRIPWDPMG